MGEELQVVRAVRKPGDPIEVVRVPEDLVTTRPGDGADEFIRLVVERVGASMDLDFRKGTLRVWNAKQDSWISVNRGDYLRIDRAPEDVYPIAADYFEENLEVLGSDPVMATRADARKRIEGLADSPTLNEAAMKEKADRERLDVERELRSINALLVREQEPQRGPEHTLTQRFTYVPPRDAVDVQKHEAINDQLLETAQVLQSIVPPGRERSLAITKLLEAKHWANAGLAMDRAGEEE